MAMANKKQLNPSHVLIFVEGDTDEVLFKALIDYYASVSSNKLLPYDICNLKGVTRYSSKLLAKVLTDFPAVLYQFTTQIWQIILKRCISSYTCSLNCPKN